MGTEEIRVGQRWQDKDKRETNRICVIYRMTENYVYMYPAHFGNTKTQVRKDRLVTRWKLVG